MADRTASVTARDLLHVSIMKTLTILLAAVVAAGCSSSGAAVVRTTSAELPPPDAHGEYHVAWPSEGSGVPRTITLQLGPDLHEYCRDVSPKFEFDKSTTYTQDRAQLLALASCLNKPGLENRHVLLVGRADPRGTDAYNLALGERRANAIKDFLVSAGLSASRIDISSRGKSGAKGTLPEYSYGYDRRVDVVVTGGPHHP